MKKLLLVFPILFFIFDFLMLAAAAEIPLIEPFKKTDRILIVSPHPDDDIIACAGIIQRALKAGAGVRVVYITCGDNNIFSIIFYSDLFSMLINNKIFYLVQLALSWREYFIALGRTRMREAINAEKILGLEEKDLIFLGYPDHGTDQMFIFSWDHTKPYHESLGGHSFVPYERGGDYNKVFTADNVIEDMKNVISDFKPTKIFVAHSSDVNGDHWASYLYVMVSLSDLGDTVPRPKVYPYLVHVPDWPLPRHYHPELAIGPPEKFFGDATQLNDWHQLKLTPEEIEKKHEAMRMHESQMRVSAFYLLAFVRQNEIFGDFPPITLKKQSSAQLPDKDIFTTDTQWIGYAIVDDALWVRVKQPDEPEDGMSLYFIIAGFRNDVPFSKMPNILVTAENNKISILNATENRRVYSENASIEVGQDYLTFRIPLEALGNPQGLLFGFEADPEHIPQGCTAFRIIRIEQGK